MALNVDFEEKANTVDPERLKKIIADIERKIDAKLSHKMEYVESCKSFNEAISNAYEMGAAFVPKKILKAKIKERELQRKIAGIAEDFEDDDRSLFDEVSQALGDFGEWSPLGAAAKEAAAKADAAPKKPRGRPRKAPSAAAPESEAKPAEADDDDCDLRPPHLQRTDIADEDTEAFKAGVAARKDGKPNGIPDTYQGDDRDLWDSGWRAADAEAAQAAAENTERLNAGISPLH